MAARLRLTFLGTRGGELCRGVRIAILDRSALDAPRLGLEIAAALHRLYPSEFAMKLPLTLVGPHLL